MCGNAVACTTLAVKLSNEAKGVCNACSPWDIEYTGFIAAESDEEEAPPRLRHAVVGGIEHVRSYFVHASEAEVVEDLLPDVHLIHPCDVLHKEGARGSLGYDIDELSVQRVAWLVYEADVVSDLREALARGASYNDIGASSQLDEAASDVRNSDVADHRRGLRKVESVRGRSIGIGVRPCQDVKAYGAEAFGESSRSAEEVHQCRLRGV